MAKVKLNKVEIVALLEDSKAIIDLLQRSGTLEIGSFEPREDLQQFYVGNVVSQFERYADLAQRAYEILTSYAPRKKSLLDSFSARTEISAAEFDKRVEDADDVLSLCSDIVAYKKASEDKQASVIRLRAANDRLEPWLKLDVPTGSKQYSVLTVLSGTLPGEWDRGAALGKIAQYAPDAELYDAEIISSGKVQTCLTVFSHESCRAEVEQALRNMGFADAPDTGKLTPAELKEENDKKIAAALKEADGAIDKIREHGDKAGDIEFVLDYLAVRCSKYKALSDLAVSSTCFVLNGWIPADKADGLRRQIEGKYAAVVTITEPEEDDDEPTLLKNNSFVAPVESITEMYSTPSKADVDPNPVMAFFYYALFGLMLSDAGYGLIMTIAMLIAKKKLKLEEKTKKTVNMFLYCGISTMFWGVMFGSFFGDIIDVVCREFLGKEPPRYYVWLQPVEEPMMLLLYCFLFGIIHLFAGLAVRFWQLWKAGKKLDAICDTVFVYFLIGGIAPMGASLVAEIPKTAMTIGGYFAIVGAAGIVLTSGRSAKNIVGKLGGGLYGLYNTASGYLGDVLSYSRLLALGLSTGVIAQVFNMLGTIPSNKVVKAVTLTVVFIIGHTVNIAINLIGTYVHTNRLQYVEFFSKFYEGGGRSFTPFASDTKYYKFSEEEQQ